MKVAVTGAGGRLGSALVAALESLARGAGDTAEVRGSTPGSIASEVRRSTSGSAAPEVRGSDQGGAAAPFGGADVDPWSRPAIDLDRPETLAALVRERRPTLVIHAAAWTDVDGCARDPGTAMRRNGEATAALAEACREAGADLVFVSTNEVFDGRRTDGRPYVEDDEPSPANPYGRSKRAGEEAVLAAYAPPDVGELLAVPDGSTTPAPDAPDVGDLLIVPDAHLAGSRGVEPIDGASDTPAGGKGRAAGSPGVSQAPSAPGSPGASGSPRPPRAWIVRTAWLYGPPGADFPAKIVAAAERAADRPLRLVADEVGSPTRAADLAAAILDLVAAAPPTGAYHLVNAGAASRAEWAEAVLGGIGLAVPTEHVPAATWQRASTPPAWGVLGTDRAASIGIRLRDWRAALRDELPRYRALVDGASGSGGASG